MATKKATTEAVEVKEVKEVKVEAPVVEKAPAKKAPAKKAEAKKATAEKKEVAEKKAPAKKAATTAKKAPAKKAAAKAETVITLEFGDYSAIMATVEEKVKAQYVAEGHKASSIKTLNIYVKPFENSAYYVVNGDVTGRVDLF